MVAVLAPIEKQTHHIPVWLSAVFTTDSGLARRQYRRQKVNDLSPLWPESHLRQKALHFAKKFIDDMKLQGYDLLTSEADVLVSGPYRSRNLQSKFGATATTKHHVARSNKQVTVLPIVGRQGAEDPFPDKEDFLIEAQFLSSRVRLVEHNLKAASGG